MNWHKIKAAIVRSGRICAVHDIQITELKSLYGIEEQKRLLKENTKPIKAVVIQPGAESTDLIAFFEEAKIPYINGCLLVGMSLYKKS